MIFLINRVYVEYLPLGLDTHKGVTGNTLQKDFKSFLIIFHCFI
jgi:hypothetical protein